MKIATPVISLDQMRAERSEYAGASDIGKLLLDHDGHPIHPYGSPHEVWLDKMGLGKFQESERTIMGQLLEPIIAKRFQIAQPGIRLQSTGTVTAQNGESWHRCNPDRLVMGRVSQVPGTSIVAKDPKGLTAILQMKTAGHFGAQGFGLEGTDEVPDWYVAQVQWELYCTGRELAILGLLHDTHLYRQFLIYRDESLINTLKLVVDSFWKRYVFTQEPPPVTSHKKDTEWLNSAWAPKNDQSIVANEFIDHEVDILSRELASLDKLELNINLRKNRLKEFMGDHGSLLTSIGEVTWKSDKNGKRTMRLDQIKPARATTPKQKVS